LVAVLQYGGFVLVDPRTGKITHRWPLPITANVSAASPDALIAVFYGADGPRLATINDSRLQSMTLQGISVGTTASGGDRPGLVLDPSERIAFVIDGSGRIARVDLKAMTVEYHEISSLRPIDSTGPRVSQRYGLQISADKLAVVGQDLIG